MRNRMTMTTDPTLTLHQWLSPAFPIGAFAYSHGLEWEVAAGRVNDLAGFQSWLTMCMAHGAGRNDAILVAAAHHARNGPSGDADKAGGNAALAQVAELAEALAPSGERREETMAQGRAFAATVSAVHGVTIPPLAYPVAFGHAAGVLDLPLPLTLRLFLQAFCANLTSAAVRLVPLGQTDGQRVLAGMRPLIERLAHDALPGDLDAIGGAVPMIDIASMRHESQRTRLFRS